MTTANTVIQLALRTSGVIGIGQTAAAEDSNDALLLLNDMIGVWNAERVVRVIPTVLATFPNLATDVPSWTGNENPLIWGLATRLRTAYALPPDESMAKLADDARQLLQANNRQQAISAVGTGLLTALQIVYAALRAAGRITDTQGVAQTSQDVTDAFGALQAMMALWGKRRWLVWSLQELVIPSTGARSYLVGPGQTVNVARPDNIQDAFARLLSTSPPNQIDYKLQVLDSREDYNSIALKSLTTFPATVYYQPDYPFGSLFFWPVPTTQFELHVFVKSGIQQFATINDAIALPAGYSEALVYSLAERLIALFGLPERPAVSALARAAVNTIRVANSQVGNLTIPSAVLGQRFPSLGLWSSGVVGQGPLP